MVKKLYKSRRDVKIDGVCAGVAKYIGLDVTLVRIIWILLGFTSTGFIIYLVCMMIMPREPEIQDEDIFNNPN